jgi:hypothetical protein
MASRRTWFWIVGGVLASGIVVLVAAAAAGIYYVSRHVQSERSSSVDAIRTFEEVRTTFGESKPLFEVDRTEQPRAVRPLSALPTASHRPRELWVLAWDPDNERIVRLSMPFWMLRLGKQKFTVAQGRTGVDLEHLELDFNELERIGPAVVFDYRDPDGGRVLLWTQ